MPPPAPEGKPLLSRESVNSPSSSRPSSFRSTSMFSGDLAEPNAPTSPTEREISSLTDDPDTPLQKPKSSYTLREKIYLTFEDPSFSTFAKILNIYLVVLIVFSTVCFCLQSVHSLSSSQRQKDIWFAIDLFVTINFTIDYLLRLFTCPAVIPFIISPMNLIDLTAIVPFYVGLALGEGGLETLAVVRVLRMVRIFRILKVGKSVEVVGIMGSAFSRSREGIFVLLFLITLAMVFFSSFIFYAETSICDFDEAQGKWIYSSGIKDGEETPYQNIVASFWWTIVTLTTVGYGDTYPVSGLGKFVASLTMISGILVLAFPISIISLNLTETYDDFRKEKELRARRKKMRQEARSFEGKSRAELIELLDTYQQKFGEMTENINQKVKEVNEHMEDLTKIHREIDSLTSWLRRSL